MFCKGRLPYGQSHSDVFQLNYFRKNYVRHSESPHRTSPLSLEPTTFWMLATIILTWTWTSVSSLCKYCKSWTSWPLHTSTLWNLLAFCTHCNLNTIGYWAALASMPPIPNQNPISRLNLHWPISGPAEHSTLWRRSVVVAGYSLLWRPEISSQIWTAFETPSLLLLLMGLHSEHLPQAENLSSYLE